MPLTEKQVKLFFAAKDNPEIAAARKVSPKLADYFRAKYRLGKIIRGARKSKTGQITEETMEKHKDKDLKWKEWEKKSKVQSLVQRIDELMGQGRTNLRKVVRVKPRKCSHRVLPSKRT